MTDDQSSGQGLKSLDTALGVLALVARYNAPQTLSTIASDCGMSPSKAHRYLASFVQAGLIKQEGRSGRYGIGPEALQLGVTAIAQHDFVDDAADGLADLVDETGMTALVTVWANEGATVVRWKRGPTPTDTAIGLGTTMPLLNSATGHVFLAWAPKAAMLDVAKRQMRLLARNPLGRDSAPTSKAELDTLIKKTRARGFAAVTGYYIPGLVAVAAPILDWQGEAQAAVTLVGIDPEATRADSQAVSQILAFCEKRSLAT
ncbi:IclR family transcriptional regulator [Phaeobacter sp. C3_T13_0]|uniref:IclR family transcriptional regulator n=1 Tax=Phaeobacter cretensis TaxID=3342641 RepID=UPI0039BCDA53